MGLSRTSTGSNLLADEFQELKNKCDYTVALAGNPNVGKSTIFNALTGMHQHTGNWPGKTVSNAAGEFSYMNNNFLFIDIPGTYSIMSNSEEEQIARDYICFGNPSATVIVLDATCLERNLNLVYQIMEITDNIIVCVNLLDEAKKKGISIDLNLLSKELGVPVVGTTARKKKTLNKLLKTINDVCTKKVIPSPKPIQYIDIFEENITLIKNELQKEFNLFPKISKWISLKLLDGDLEIIKSIKINLDIDITNNLNIQNKVLEVQNKLKDYGIDKNNFNDNIISSIVMKCEDVCEKVNKIENNNYKNFDRKIDKMLTSKKFGIPLMLLFLGIIFWITIVGANYPSQLLSNFFLWIQNKLLIGAEQINMPTWLSNMLILGVYQTLTWIIAVMLPPMAIFFPLFTILEDLGYLPRIAFNLDGFFKKACTNGKQMITMCMGFGCNAAGVVGCRIIDSPREKLIAILTNAFVPCNGRFPFLITISTVFIAGSFSGFTSSIISTFVVICVILLGILMTLFISKLLSKTILKGVPSSFILELPPYRKPQIGKVIIRSIVDRTLFVLGRAILVAAPAGLVIWLFANIGINGSSILCIIANFFDPFAKLMGLDGYILTAFILGFPANEIVLPIILMCYLGGTSLSNVEDNFKIGSILLQNGWNILTAINVMIFTTLHFPCSTTILTIKKETGSWKWSALAFALPTICGIALCLFTNLIYNIIFI